MPSEVCHCACSISEIRTFLLTQIIRSASSGSRFPHCRDQGGQSPLPFSSLCLAHSSHANSRPILRYAQGSRRKGKRFGDPSGGSDSRGPARVLRNNGATPEGTVAFHRTFCEPAIRQ